MSEFEDENDISVNPEDDTIGNEVNGPEFLKILRELRSKIAGGDFTAKFDNILGAGNAEARLALARKRRPSFQKNKLIVQGRSFKSNNLKGQCLKAKAMIDAAGGIADLVELLLDNRKVLEVLETLLYEHQHYEDAFSDALRLKYLDMREALDQLPTTQLRFVRALAEAGIPADDFRSFDGKLMKAIKQAITSLFPETEGEFADALELLRMNEIDENPSRINRLDRASIMTNNALNGGNIELAQKIGETMHAARTSNDYEEIDRLLFPDLFDCCDDDRAAEPSASYTGGDERDEPSDPPQHDRGFHSTGTARCGGIGRLADYAETRVGALGFLPFGGFVRADKIDPINGFIQMQDRADPPAADKHATTEKEHWSRFECGYGPYVLLPTLETMPILERLADKCLFPFQTFVDSCESQPRYLSKCPSVFEEAKSSYDMTNVIHMMRVNTGFFFKDMVRNELLKRLNLFMLVARHRSRETDTLFPQGYFHGLIIPDYGSENIGFRIMHCIRGADLSEAMEFKDLPKFETPERFLLDGLV